MSQETPENATRSDSAGCASNEEERSWSHPVTQGAIQTLLQGERLLESIPSDAFTSPCPLAFGASIGQHYRHCLEHFQIFFRQIESATINFDARERDPKLEQDLEFALEITRSFRFQIENLDISALDRPIVVYSGGSSDRALRNCDSSVGRELMYATFHAIHHYALIGIIARRQGLGLDPEFGVAPSTLQFQRNLAAEPHSS